MATTDGRTGEVEEGTMGAAPTGDFGAVKVGAVTTALGEGVDVEVSTGAAVSVVAVTVGVSAGL